MAQLTSNLSQQFNSLPDQYGDVDSAYYHRRIQRHCDHTGTVWCDIDTRFGVDASGPTRPVGNMLLGIVGSVTGCVSLLFFNSG